MRAIALVGPPPALWNSQARAYRRLHGSQRIAIAAILRAGDTASVAASVESALRAVQHGYIDVLGGQPSPPAFLFKHHPVAVLLQQ